MLYLKEGPDLAGTFPNPDYIDLLHNIGNLLESVRQGPSAVEATRHTPIKSGPVGRWHPYIILLRSPNGAKQSLHLRMREIGHAHPGDVHQFLQSRPAEPTLNTEPPGSGNIQLGPIAVQVHLHLVLAIASRGYSAEDVLIVRERHDQRLRLPLPQEAHDRGISLQLVQVLCPQPKKGAIATVHLGVPDVGARGSAP